MAFQTAKTVEEVLKQIYNKDYLMPAIQREFVWGTDDIVKLFDSLLRGYPVGSFLFWRVGSERVNDYVFYGFIRDYHEKNQPFAQREKPPAGQGTTAILDGQQRLTSLNIGLYGSYASRRLYGRVNSENAYPQKRLYLNLLDTRASEDLGLKYDLQFLTKEEAARRDGQPDHWFLVGDVLKLKGEATEYLQIAKDRGFEDFALATDAINRLDALHKAIRVTGTMNYFEVVDDDPDKVLEIFIRVNSGGAKLTKSDLLLSMATNQWSNEPGAREEVRNLVLELNGRDFAFNKDFVLKSALMMVGADVRFQVSSITHANIAKIEEAWPRIRSALLLAADFLRQSGFSSRTLTANNAAAVIAYWFFKIEGDYSFLESSHTAADRSRMVSWVTRSLLKQGVWGSGVDTLITRLRSELGNAEAKHGFPAEALEGALASLGKSLSFDQVEIDAMLDWEYQGPKTKPLLALLRNGIDGTKKFEEDHIFPKSIFTKSELLRRGISAELVPTYISFFNTLPNLQLLVGTRNNEKLAMLPADWLQQHFSSEADREIYLSENFMSGLPLATSR
jgi:uncharacterized protein with ParB-like and HNH nuclease domain